MLSPIYQFVLFSISISLVKHPNKDTQEEKCLFISSHRQNYSLLSKELRTET